MPTIRAGTVGLAIRLNASENGGVLPLAAATNLKIDLTRPDGTVLTRTAVLSTDGTDGKFQYVTIAGDLPNDATGWGEWQAMGTFTLAGWTGSTTAAVFTVDPAF